MKKILFAGVAMMMYTASAQDIKECTHNEEKAAAADNGIAIVTGRGDVLPEGVMVRFIQWKEGVGDYIATDTIENGQFRFEIPVEDGLTVGALMFDYHAFPSMIHKLYLTPGAKVEIEAVDNYTFTWPVKSSVPEQSEYDLYINDSKDLWTEYQVANIEYNKFRNREANLQKSDSLGRLIRLRELDFLKTRPIGTVWLDKAKDLAMISHRLKIDTEGLKTMYSTLDDSIRNSPKGRAIYGYLYPGSHLETGDRFPDTEFYDIDGNAHRFSEFMGKWCLVDFWNSGCGPCRRALPELRELKEKYPDTLELISLSMDTDRVWRKASEDLSLIGNNWNEGKEDYGIFRRFGTNAYPTFLVVAPDGTIHDVWVGYATGELKQKIDSIFMTDSETDANE